MGRSSGMDSAYRDESWLREQYEDRGRSGPDIADGCGVSAMTVYNWLERFGVDRRSHSEAKGKDADELYKSRSWLFLNYWVLLRPTNHMADRAGCDESTITSWMERLGVPVRTAHETERIRGSQRGSDNGMWQGGLVEDWRRRGRWRTARRRTVERDGGECVECGAEPDTPHVHHIESPLDGGSRFALDNLETLCPPCHHSTF